MVVRQDGGRRVSKNGLSHQGIEAAADLTARALERVEVALTYAHPSTGRVWGAIGVRGLTRHLPFLRMLCEKEI